MRNDYHLLEHVYYISPDGVQYPLFGGRRALLGFAGLEMPGIRYISDGGPFINGERVRDYRLDSRIIDLQLYESGCSRQARWDNLGEIMDAVRPNRGGVGQLLVVLPDWTERAIDAWILSGPDGTYKGSDSLLAFDIRENLRFLAPYPIWYDPAANSLTFAVSVSDSCLPTCLPTCLGSGLIVASATITYPGTFESFPTITLTGPMNHPEISNDTTGETISLEYDIASGETVTVATSHDGALVYNNVGVNLIGTVADVNDLTTFSIRPAGVSVPGGVNVISVTASGGTVGMTAVTIEYYDRYLGVPK